MLLVSAIGIVAVALIGLSAIILFDVRRKGWSLWTDTLRDWQNVLGAVVGFISAAGVLMFSSAIQGNAELDRSERASFAIGQALAYEVERMISPLQRAYTRALNIDRSAANVVDQCVLLFYALRENMISSTPVYDAVLGQTLDFGEENLALFTRFYGYHYDFRHELGISIEEACAVEPAIRIQYVVDISQGAFKYYEHVMANYPNVTPLQPEVVLAMAAPAPSP